MSKMRVCGRRPQVMIVPLLLFLFLCPWLLLSAATSEGEAAPSVVTIRSSLIANKPVMDWSVEDVEYWMLYVVGYPEYSAYLRKHLIDGPTLLEMRPKDLEEHLPIENSLHVIKLEAHLKLIKGLCLCPTVETPVSDLWSYMKQNNFRVWVVGTTSIFFPRLGMLYTFLFDGDLYRMLVGVDVPQPSVLESAAAANDSSTLESSATTTQEIPILHTFLFLLGLVLSPNIFMVCEVLRMVTTNYVIMPALVVHFLFEAYTDCIFLWLLYTGAFFPPGLSLLKKIGLIFPYTSFIPFITILSYPVIPYFMQVILICLLVLSCFVLVFAALSVNFFREAAGENAKDGFQGEEKRK